MQAEVDLGGGFSAVVQDGPDDDIFGISGTFGLYAEVAPLGLLQGDFMGVLGSVNAGINGFKLELDSMRMDIGNMVTFQAKGIAFDAMALGRRDQSLLSVGSAAVTLDVAGLRIGGSARNFGIQGDGSLRVEKNFAVVMSMKGGGADGLGLPKWMPVSIDTLVLEWRDLKIGRAHV